MSKKRIVQLNLDEQLSLKAQVGGALLGLTPQNFVIAGIHIMSQLGYLMASDEDPDACKVLIQDGQGKNHEFCLDVFKAVADISSAVENNNN